SGNTNVIAIEVICTVTPELNALVNLKVSFQEFACRCQRDLHGVGGLQIHLKNGEFKFPGGNPVLQVGRELRVTRKHETAHDTADTFGPRRKLKLRIV